MRGGRPPACRSGSPSVASLLPPSIPSEALGGAFSCLSPVSLCFSPVFPVIYGRGRHSRSVRTRRFLPGPACTSTPPPALKPKSCPATSRPRAALRSPPSSPHPRPISARVPAPCASSWLSSLGCCLPARRVGPCRGDAGSVVPCRSHRVQLPGAHVPPSRTRGAAGTGLQDPCPPASPRAGDEEGEEGWPPLLLEGSFPPSADVSRNSSWLGKCPGSGVGGAPQNEKGTGRSEEQGEGEGAALLTIKKQLARPKTQPGWLAGWGAEKRVKTGRKKRAVGRKRAVFGKAGRLQRAALFWAQGEACPLDLLLGPSPEQGSARVAGDATGSSAGGAGGGGSINPGQGLTCCDVMQFGTRLLFWLLNT